jgi:rubrerythrin
MELGTFGAILNFAMELEKQAADFYEAGIPGERADVFRSLARSARKRLGRLEQARRELVAEMILESITGLASDVYDVTLGPAAGEADRRRQACALEEAAASFYRDAAAKMPIREVVRLFRRMAAENEQHLVELG